MDASIVVVGAGPAGLAAAHALAQRGERRILVLDRDDAPGGLPRFCHHAGFGWEFTHRLETGPRFARRLLAALDPEAVTVIPRTTVLAVHPGPEVEILGAELGHQRLRPRAVVLATGIRERPRSARLVPGRRPERGVLTTGQLQQFVARGVAVGGRRAVVVGTEHVAFSVLFTARRAGLAVVAMIGAEDRVMSYAGAAWAARLVGVPIHLDSSIEDIEGDARVEAVIVRGPGGPRRIACDTVVFCGDFIPDAPLVAASGIALDRGTAGPIVDQFGRTSAPGVFAAGNLLRAVESSGRAAIEGARVGGNVGAYLGGRLGWDASATPIGVGSGLAYAMPQRWAAPGGSGEALAICLGALVDMPQARLCVRAEGATRWMGAPTRILRKRRLTLPPAALAAVAGARAAEISVEGA
ncbi:MAG: FAD-dependent oxidoreductase [Alphaproteobacteria bacterium]|nr:FAD-dependent oxidoreductase [Alphaproteobacteria bacterium]